MRTRAVVALGLVWVALTGGVLLAMGHFGSTPGDPGAPPAAWPSSTALVRATGRPTLLLWAHPRCACTRASVGELARLMALLEERVDATVVIQVPDGVGEDWTTTDTVAAARAIPGVRVVLDRGEEETGRFGAATSGHVLLYGPAGDLWFSGGLTPSRGHAGDSTGREAILSRVLAGEVTTPRSATFGCALAGPEAE